jgi:hypothetical protein
VSKVIHMCVSVRGVLRKSNAELERELRGCVTNNDGKTLYTAEEIRAAFSDELSKGHEVVPCSETCEGFDYKTGCPGHEVPGCEIIIPALPPSKNEYGRRHWATQHKLREWWYLLVKEFFSTRRYPERLKGPVDIEIEFHFPDNRLRDVQNLIGFPPLWDVLTPEKVNPPRRIKTGKRAGHVTRGTVKLGLGIIEEDNHKAMRIIPADPVIDGTRQTVIRIWSREES